MQKALKEWRKLAIKHESHSKINREYLYRAIFEGEIVMRKLNNAYHNRFDAYTHFARVAALYSNAGLFTI